MSVGENIRRIRLEKGITQMWLADKAGITQAMLCQIERETKNPSIQVGKAIADAMHISMDDLFEREEKNGEPQCK